MDNGVLLCLVNGPWQALSLVASLRELALPEPQQKLVTVLVDMEHGSPFHAATTRILQANGMRDLHMVSKQTPLHALPEAVRAIERASAITLAQVGMVATYGVHRPIARYFVSLTERAKVLIYEEGLRAYVPPSTSLRQRARKRLAQAWGRVDPNFARAWTFPEEGARELAYCLLLGRRLPTTFAVGDARVHHVRDDHLRSALAASPAPTLRREAAAPYVLIIGQYYARLKQMPFDVELAAYTRAACSIVRRGQIPVWRGHPREEDACFAQLRAGCPELLNFSDLVDDPSLPLELYAELTNSCRGAVSFSSSALFYLSYLYGIATETLLTDRLVARMSYPHREACALALQHIAPFQALESAA